MKPFKFKLETVLNLRLKEEEQQQLRLNQAIKNRDEAQSLLEMLLQRQVKYQGLLRELLLKDPTGSLANSVRHYLPQLADNIEQQRLLVAQLVSLVEKERQTLLEIIKKRKILEKLKAKNYFVYTRALLREEQNRIDEIATQQFFLKELVRP